MALPASGRDRRGGRGLRALGAVTAMLQVRKQRLRPAGARGQVRETKGSSACAIVQA